MGIKKNNKVINLQWVTNRENIQNYYTRNTNRYKYSSISQYDLNNNFIKKWNSVEEILKNNLNIKKGPLLIHLNGKTLTSYGCKWIGELNREYKEPIKNENILNIKTDEIFKNIGIFECKNYNNYEVSNYGNIRNIGTKKILTSYVTKEGYNVCSLYINTTKKITVMVHRLVAHAFIDGRTEEKWTVNHKNENKQNNHVSNLEWSSNRDQGAHSKGIKIQQLDPISEKVMNTFSSIAEAFRYLKNEGKTLSNYAGHGHIKYSITNNSISYGYKWKLLE